jgi:hypothetical protein
MARKREVSQEVKDNRRKILDAGQAAYGKAVDAGDEAGAAALLEEMKALKLVVQIPGGPLVTGPDVADKPG